REAVNFVNLPAPDRENAAEILKRNGIVYVEFSRGCSWGRCTFCSMWGGQHKQWRHKSIDLLIQELNILQAIGAKKFEFTDSDFMGPNPRRVEDLALYQEFARRKIESGNTMTFFAYLRVQSVYCEKDVECVKQEKIRTLQLLKRAGLRVVGIGVDCGSNAQNKRFNKGTTKKEAQEAVCILKEVGIETIKVGMVLFDPFMSFEELLEGISFVRESGLKEYVYFPFVRLTLYEGTLITGLAREQGVLSEERDIALSFRVAEFLDQRVGRLARIFDVWHRENKPFIFGIQGIRREMMVDEQTKARIHVVLVKLHEQYYSFLDAIVTAYAQQGIRRLEEKIAENLLLRSCLLKDLAEMLESWCSDKRCADVHFLAVEAYHSDILMVKVLQDSAQGVYLDWDIYRRQLIVDVALPAKIIENILQMTLVRVLELVSWRNPRLHVPNPQMIAVHQRVDGCLDQIAEITAVLIGESKDRLRGYLEGLAETEDGIKLLWVLDRRLSKVQSKKEVYLLKQLGFELAVKYLLMLSWEIECGNDDLLFVDIYNGQHVEDLLGLKRAVSFCFNELDVNKRSSITSKKLFFLAQIDQFNIEDMPGIDGDTSEESFWDKLDKEKQLTSMGLAVFEIDFLELNKGVFNPVLYYQMTGLLAKVIRPVSGVNVLDVGSGTGILGI
ncbi:MAG: radical SAM protein, partial [Candidatus Omnitrophica bacterium]|nr:radical SAM protein [Candidatus Omnitrophota bacterium]